MSKLIFLIDDSRTIILALSKMLTEGGFDVETAEDGNQALEKLKKINKPDLIITDINMPNMDGIEFIRQARQVLRFTPILALTTESQKDKRDQARKVGATGWLVKPISSQDLIKTINIVTGRK